MNNKLLVPIMDKICSLGFAPITTEKWLLLAKATHQLSEATMGSNIDDGKFLL